MKLGPEDVFLLEGRPHYMYLNEDTFVTSVTNVALGLQRRVGYISM